MIDPNDPNAEKEDDGDDSDAEYDELMRQARALIDSKEMFQIQMNEIAAQKASVIDKL